MSRDPINVVHDFEQAINSRDPAAIVALLTPDSVFVDSMGAPVQTPDKLRAAWTAYFSMVPDYAISHDEILTHGDTVAVFGSARGTFSPDGHIRRENFWEPPAAWRARIRDGKIALWQVFTDNEPIRLIVRRNSDAPRP